MHLNSSLKGHWRMLMGPEQLPSGMLNPSP